MKKNLKSRDFFENIKTNNELLENWLQKVREDLNCQRIKWKKSLKILKTLKISIMSNWMPK